jgi:pyruvate dehydrogenase E2 component (dihydrolipoamide acetyltransferase)
MPKLGADMAAGTLVAWKKGPGDVVRRGDIIAEVETDKGVIDVEIFTDGVVETLLVQPAEKVPVGTPLATVRVEGEAAPVAPATQPATEPARPRASPAARELARTLGVDLARVTGTGPGGAIGRDDVERAAKAAAPMTEADKVARMRQAIAAAMARSKREIPHYYLSTTIDLDAATTWLAEQNAARPVTERLLIGALFLKAVALALRRVPELNAVWADDHNEPQPAVHVGVAVALRGGGLVAPAVHEADQLTLHELMAKLQDLVSRVRAGRVRSSELSDPTITVTSLGDQGVEATFGVIYPPQVAIVGFGKVVERPWVAGGKVVPRPVVTATLSADHRASDGHRGGLFLAAVDRLLQEPGKL